MLRNLHIIVIILVILIAIGCSSPESSRFPTPIPTEFLPTALALTVAADRPTGTQTPTETRSPEPSRSPTVSYTPTETSTPTSTLTPSITPTPTASFTPSVTPVPIIPLAEIEIRTPGELSKVVSPIPLRAALVPGAGGKVTIELLGEDGRLLTREITTLNENLGRKAGLALDLDFEIPGVSELGRLQISILDEYGRPKAMSSVHLILLSAGVSDLNVVTDLLTWLVIEDPVPGDLIQGGTLIVSGLARPTNIQPLLAELIAEDGKVIGFRLIDVGEGPDNKHRPFLVEVPYSVSEPSRARLVVRERGDRITGTVNLSSLEILVSP